MKKTGLFTRTNKQWVILIFLFAFVLRLGFVIYSYNTDITAKFRDDLLYMDFAEMVLKQGPFVPHIEQFKSDKSASIGPGLPWYMAFLMGIFGKSWLAIFIVNALIGSLVCVLIFLVGKTLFGQPVGLMAAAWSTFYVLFVRCTATAGKEVLLTFLFLSIILLVIKSSGKGTRRRYFILLVFGYSYLVHTDERYLAYLPLIMFFLFYLGEGNWKNAVKKAVAFPFFVLVLMVPWFVRNYTVYNKTVIISKRTAHLTDKLFGYEAESYPSVVKGKWYLSEAEIEEVLKGERTTRATGKTINKLQVQAMKDGILPHGFTTLESYWSILQILWKPVDFNRGYSTTGYRYDGAWSLRHNLSVGLTYGILLPFLFIGLYYCFRQRRKIAVFLFSILLFHTLIHMLFIPFTRNRYRVSLDGIIIVLAFYGLYRLYLKIKKSPCGGKDAPGTGRRS